MYGDYPAAGFPLSKGYTNRNSSHEDAVNPGRRSEGARPRPSSVALFLKLPVRRLKLKTRVAQWPQAAEKASRAHEKPLDFPQVNRQNRPE